MCSRCNESSGDWVVNGYVKPSDAGHASTTAAAGLLADADADRSGPQGLDSTPGQTWRSTGRRPKVLSGTVWFARLLGPCGALAAWQDECRAHLKCGTRWRWPGA
jgi:hypothetical protein